jgi:hypothetical protein
MQPQSRQSYRVVPSGTSDRSALNQIDWLLRQLKDSMPVPQVSLNIRVLPSVLVDCAGHQTVSLS